MLVYDVCMFGRVVCHNGIMSVILCARVCVCVCVSNVMRMCVC
jgi:hypothetical protein